jgi:hypothetical protein
MCASVDRGSVVPSSPVLVTLMMEALSSSETSVLTRATLRNIREDAILHSHCRKNLKYCTFIMCVKFHVSEIFLIVDICDRTRILTVHTVGTLKDGRFNVKHYSFLSFVYVCKHKKYLK